MSQYQLLITWCSMMCATNPFWIRYQYHLMCERRYHSTICLVKLYGWSPFVGWSSAGVSWLLPTITFVDCGRSNMCYGRLHFVLTLDIRISLLLANYWLINGCCWYIDVMICGYSYVFICIHYIGQGFWFIYHPMVLVIASWPTCMNHVW